MFPVLPFKRSGRKSAPPHEILVQPLEREHGYQALETVLRQTVDRAVITGTGGVQGAFDNIADYLMKYKSDDLGDRLHTSMSAVLKPEIMRMNSNTSVTAGLSTAAVMVLDQLFSLLLRRDPQLAEVVQCTREVIHRSIFPNPPVTAPKLPVPLIREYEVNIVDDFLRDYTGQRTYFESAADLVDRCVFSNHKLVKTQECLEHNMKSTKWYLKTWKKMVMTKALVGWRLQAQQDKMVRQLKSTAVDREGILKVCQTDLSRVKMRLRTMDVDLNQQIEVLRSELHLTHKAHDTAVALAEHRRRECVELREHVQYMEIDQFADMQEQVNKLEASLTQWKSSYASIRVGNADNAFERFNRSRLEYYTYAEPSISLLFQWATDAVKFLPQASYCKFSDFSAPNACAAYILLMHCLSPGHVPHSAVDSGFGSGPAAQAEAAVYYCKSLVVGKQLNAKRLLAAHPGEHYSLLLALFLRFSGVGAVTPWLSPSAEDWKIWARRMDNFPATSFQTQEVQQDVDAARIQIVKESETLENWGLVANKMQATVTTILMANSMKRGSTITPHDKEQFCTLNPNQLSDVEGISEDTINVMERETLSLNCNELRLVYVFYATGSFKADNNIAMKGSEFMDFVADTKIIDKKYVKEKVIKDIFTNCITSSIDESMYPKQFVEALVKMSAACHFPAKLLEDGIDDDSSGKTDQQLSLPVKLKILVEEFILKYTNGAAIAQFKARFRDNSVQDVLEANMPLLKKVFRHYAAEDANDALNEMNEKEFQRFCADGKVSDEVCTHMQLQQLFAKVPDTSIEVRKLYESPDGGGKSKGLRLDEFKELVCAIALFKSPSPFIALHQKVQRFVDGFLSPLTLAKK